MEIAEIHSRLKQFRDKVVNEWTTLSPQLLSRAEDEGKWSIVNVFEHLQLASEDYLRQLKEGITRSSVNKTQKVEFTITGKIFLQFVNNKITFKVPAPGLFMPASAAEANYIIRQFEKFQEELLRTSSQISQHDFNKIKVRSPLSSLLRFKGGEALHIIATHQERHQQQIERILDKYKA